MTTLHHEARIAAPVAEVWRAIAGDLTAVQHYNDQVASARIVGEQRDGVGATRRCELRPKGFVEERVTAWTPHERIGLEVAASSWPIVFMAWQTDLAVDGDGTRVTQVLSYKLRFGPVGALLNALVMRRKLDAGIRDVFERLRAYVERRDVA